MKKFVFICMLSVFLNACFTGRSPDSTFYLFEQMAQKSLSNKKTAILIEKIKVPALVDKPQIVLKKENSPEVIISEFNRWGEPLPNMIRQTLIADLSTYLPNAFIKPNDYNTEGKFDYTLLIEVDSFIGEQNSWATLSVWWTLKDKNDKIIARKKSIFESHTSKDYASYVEGQSYNIDELAQEVVKTLIK
ncbi:MAG: membrane integrity-associated transporter subunit PqiC [Alphaproteobacteria bacterium]|nr:membrane integrity-associated transporter subunit PqiC [Alphaproteobacteria bacterium]